MTAAAGVVESYIMRVCFGRAGWEGGKVWSGQEIAARNQTAQCILSLVLRNDVIVP